MKYTDEQIFENEIKCITRRNECVCNGGTDCVKCDLLMNSEEIIKCYNRAIKNIDLINRLKSENERATTTLLKKEDTMQLLHKEHQKTFDELQEVKAENERLKAMHSEMCIGLKVIKRKARKEFVERLKEKFAIRPTFRKDTIFVCETVKETIDNLLEEMESADK